MRSPPPPRRKAATKRKDSRARTPHPKRRFSAQKCSGLPVSLALRDLAQAIEHPPAEPPNGKSQSPESQSLEKQSVGASALPEISGASQPLAEKAEPPSTHSLQAAIRRTGTKWENWVRLWSAAGKPPMQWDLEFPPVSIRRIAWMLPEFPAQPNRGVSNWKAKLNIPAQGADARLAFSGDISEMRWKNLDADWGLSLHGELEVKAARWRLKEMNAVLSKDPEHSYTFQSSESWLDTQSGLGEWNVRAGYLDALFIQNLQRIWASETTGGLDESLLRRMAPWPPEMQAAPALRPVMTLQANGVCGRAPRAEWMARIENLRFPVLARHEGAQTGGFIAELKQSIEINPQRKLLNLSLFNWQILDSPDAPPRIQLEALPGQPVQIQWKNIPLAGKAVLRLGNRVLSLLDASATETLPLARQGLEDLEALSQSLDPPGAILVLRLHDFPTARTQEALQLAGLPRTSGLADGEMEWKLPGASPASSSPSGSIPARSPDSQHASLEKPDREAKLGPLALEDSAIRWKGQGRATRIQLEGFPAAPDAFRGRARNPVVAQTGSRRPGC